MADTTPTAVPATQSVETPVLTADTVVVARDPADVLQVYLIRTAKLAFAGRWAIPGGKLHVNERLVDAAVRELAEETGLQRTPGQLHVLGYYDIPGRDPRGRYISWTFLVEIDWVRAATLTPGPEATEGAWWPLLDPPETAFDHHLALRDAATRLTHPQPASPAVTQEG
jgi:8-oxo-dGTP diphosphatase